jgi:hypothetical protein
MIADAEEMATWARKEFGKDSYARPIAEKAGDVAP